MDTYLKPDDSINLQSIIDNIAATPSATPKNVYFTPGVYDTYSTIKLKAKHSLQPVDYSGIRLIGYPGSILRLKSNATGPGNGFFHIGYGWKEYTDPFIKDIEVRNLQFYNEPTNLHRKCNISIERVNGYYINNCQFENKNAEGLIEGTGPNNVWGLISDCHAKNCGLAGYNINGWHTKLHNCTVQNSRWGAEIGGSDVTVSSCQFNNAPIHLGSCVYGASNIKLFNNLFDRSYIEIANGIGRLASVCIYSNLFLHSQIAYVGGSLKNVVDINPYLKYKFYDGPHMVYNNSFRCDDLDVPMATQVVRAVNPYAIAGNGPDFYFTNNIIDSILINNPKLSNAAVHVFKGNFNHKFYFNDNKNLHPNQSSNHVIYETGESTITTWAQRIVKKEGVYFRNNITLGAECPPEFYA